MELAGHWYDKDGKPCHFIECKTREGTRPTTLADAKKLGLFPSVTQVLKVLAKPGLQDWLIRQAVHAVCTAPDQPGEGLDDKITRILEREKQQDEEAKRARDLGTEIHAAIEERLAGRLIAPQFEPYVAKVESDLTELGRVLETEKVLVHPSGFAGKMDCLTQGYALSVIDFKTAKTLPKKSPWPEHSLQVAAYAAALGNTGNQVVQTGVLYISTVEPGGTALFLEPAWHDAWNVFQAVFTAWKFLNNYDPLTI